MVPPHDDLELLRGIERGDVAAFERVFARHHAPLCRFVESYVDSAAIAQELVQELFFDLWMQRGHWRVSQTLRAYLYAAARNRALKRARHQSVVRRWMMDAAHDATLRAMSTAPKAADVALETEELLDKLRAAVGDLPERSRMAVTLRWHEQMSYAEVAEAMGISVKGVEKLVATAMRTLRRTLEDV